MMLLLNKPVVVAVSAHFETILRFYRRCHRRRRRRRRAIQTEESPVPLRNRQQLLQRQRQQQRQQELLQMQRRRCVQHNDRTTGLQNATIDDDNTALRLEFLLPSSSSSA